MMINNTVAAPREQPISLEDYQQALEAAQQEVATLNDSYLRATAALENTRKHTTREVATQVNQRLQRLVLSMLDVADSLERAITYSTPDTPLHQGVQITQQQLLAALRGEGVVPMQLMIGSRFEPASQEAVGTRASVEAPSTIVDVQRTGYMRDGQVLRPAQVILSDPGSL
jgi:molecular chaperone GrpE